MDASLKQLAEKSLSNCSLAALGTRGGVLKEHQLDRKDSLFIGSGEGFEAGVQEEWGLTVKATCLQSSIPGGACLCAEVDEKVMASTTLTSLLTPGCAPHSVRVNLHCQFDWIYNHHGNTLQVRLKECFQKDLTEEGRLTLNVGGTIQRAGSPD